jgi:radical SAM superfamily enzyme YgiQ (UPF0313 family)
MKIIFVNVIEFEPIFEAARGVSDKKSTGYPPIGLLTLAAILEAKGYEVEVIDFGNLILNRTIDLDENFPHHAAEYIKSKGGDIVGFSSRCDNYLFSLRIAEQFRHIAPSTPIVFGGPQATITDVASLENFSFITCILRHEAELSLPPLLEALAANQSLTKVPGLVYRSAGKVAKNPDPPLIKDLDEIPMPAFKHFPIKTLTAMPIEVGRGCPFGCTFCVTNRYFNQRYRLKSADRIIDEVTLLQGQYGFKKFHFIHDMLTANRRLILQLCERIKERNIQIEWTCSARTDCVDRELLESMHAAGCRDMYFGIETGSQRLQKVVNKNLKLDSVYPVVDLCADLGISTVTSFITGFPEEKEEDVEATLRMLLELSPKVSTVQLHLYSPTPGTPLNDKFSDRLTYTGYISDFGFGSALSKTDEQMVVAHPDIFTNYFQVRPLHLDFDEIRGLDLFGYCLRSFKHFFFHLVHEPEAPTLFGVWRGLRAWLDENEVEWELEKFLAQGLTTELENYLCTLLATSTQMPPALIEAFNFDRALIRLGEAAHSLSKFSREWDSILQSNTASRNIDGDTHFVLRIPVVLTEARCDLVKMMTAMTKRQYRPLNLSERRHRVAITPLKLSGVRADKLSFTVNQLNAISEAIIEACQRPVSLREMVAAVSVHLEKQGEALPPQLKQLCLVNVKRLMACQAIQLIKQSDMHDEAVWPSLIRLQSLAPATAVIANPIVREDKNEELLKLDLGAHSGQASQVEWA